MKCPSCDSEMSCEEGRHHYTESGLDNFYLNGIEICTCACGEEIVSIPRMPELHSIIGLELIKKRCLLEAKEIKFLRKNMGLTAKRLSAFLGVDNATISRWENGSQPISKSNDRLIRLVYSSIKELPVQKIKHLIEDKFSEIVEEKVDLPPCIIPFKDDLRLKCA